MHKDLWTTWISELACQAVAVEWGWGLCLEERKARKVKIKLLWTNSLFDQAAQQWKVFLPEVRACLERGDEDMYCSVSPRLFSFTLVLAVCTPCFFVMESAWTFFNDSAPPRIFTRYLKVPLNALTHILEYWVLLQRLQSSMVITEERRNSVNAKIIFDNQ